MSDQFEFTPANLKEYEDILRRYPVKRAALLPTLHLAQDQHGHISTEVESYVADLMGIPAVDVREVVTFYSLFHQKEPGKHHIRVCTSLSCWLRGSTGIKSHLSDKLAIQSGGKTDSGTLSWEAVPDCMGACELAPMLQLDKDYHGNLTPERVDEILDGLAGNGAH